MAHHQEKSQVAARDEEGAKEPEDGGEGREVKVGTEEERLEEQGDTGWR